MMVMNSKQEKAEKTLFFCSRGDEIIIKLQFPFFFPLQNLKLQIYSNFATTEKKQMHISFIA